MNKLKLTIELVPTPLWNRSLYRICKEKGWKALNNWKKIKQNLFEKEGRCCWICNQTDVRFEAHEFWKYNEKEKIQILNSIHHLCPMCHRVKHFKHSTAFLRVPAQDLIKHFCKVNNCNKKDFDKHDRKVSKDLIRRNEIEWEQDFGDYQYIFDEINKL